MFLSRDGRIFEIPVKPLNDISTAVSSRLRQVRRL